ncbi:hypothetical protein BJ170DRAFT_735803 [Xylariales sp. AK1849]|nr:hypothetical protein BJ170DRAFT_735803 [Xylariales sp. AK1849]
MHSRLNSSTAQRKTDCAEWKEAHLPLRDHRIDEGILKWGGTPPETPPKYIPELSQAVQSSLQGIRDDHARGLGYLLGGLCTLPSDEQGIMIRIACLCTSRALSSRLGDEHPIVLNVWASYYRYWDTAELERKLFLASYKRTFERIQRSYGDNHEATISVLTDYRSRLTMFAEMCLSLRSSPWTSGHGLKRSAQG